MLVDRTDRRRLVVLVNLLRAAIIGALAAAVAAGTATVALIYVALFAVGTMETLADSASTVLLPALVPAEHLPRANARLVAVQIVANQLLSRPRGAALFAVAAWADVGFGPEYHPVGEGVAVAGVIRAIVVPCVSPSLSTRS